MTSAATGGIGESDIAAKNDPGAVEPVDPVAAAYPRDKITGDPGAGDLNPGAENAGDTDTGDPDTGDTDTGEPSVVAPLLAGVLMVAFGVLMIFDALDITTTADMLRGPRLFPLAITISWTVLSACYVAQQLLRLARHRPGLPAEKFAHPLRVLGVVAALVVYAFTLEPVGYFLTTAVLFVVVAALLSSRHWLRDLVIGVGLSATIYLVFTQLLMVRLPAGVLGL